MEHQKPTTGKFAMNYGLILGLVMVTIAVLMYVTGIGLEGAQWPTYLYYIIFPVVIMYGISQYKKANANTLSLGEAIKIGIAIAAVSALVYTVYIIIFNYIIDPEYISQAMQVAKDKLLENPNMTEEQVNQTISIMEKMQSPILGSAAWLALSAFFGLIWSLIGGLVMKNNS
jgi:cation transport ATPase